MNEESEASSISSQAPTPNSRESCRGSNFALGPEQVHRSGSVSLETVEYVPFYRIVLCWLVGVTLLGGLAIRLLEGDSLTFVNGIYMAANAVSATGLSSIDLSLWRPVSKAVLLLCVQAGSSTMISLVPVALRLRGLQRLLPYERTFDLRRFRKVPQWLVEYKALVILMRVMIAYQVVVYAFYTLAIFVMLSLSGDLGRLVHKGGHAGKLEWAFFHVVSAYNNAGYSLNSDNLVSFSEHPFLLFLIAMVCLHGNVMLPVYTRWIIVFLSAVAREESSRKVFFRYLLMNGRDLYSNIFVSQQTWLLFLSQLFLILYQILVFFLVPPIAGGFANKPASVQLGNAFFLAVNTRHAGLSSINMADVPSSTIVCYLLMMFMAPAPFIAVMHSSMNTAPDPRELTVHDAYTNQSPWRVESGWFAQSSVGPQRERARSRAGSHGASGVLPDEVVEEQERQALAAASGATELARHSSTSVGHGASSRRLNLGMLMRQRELEVERDLLLRRIESGRWAERDFRTDARVLLTVLYQDEPIPWRRRVSFRIKAIGFHLRQLGADMVAGTAVRDVALIWFAWFLIAAAGGAPRKREQFALLFELVSAYGNVGLSLGSHVKSNPNASFSGQFNDLGLFVMIGVELLGTMRSMPLTADSVFIMRMPPSPEDLLRPGTVPEGPEEAVEMTDSHVSS